MKEKLCFLSILVHGYHQVLYTSDQYLYSRFVICLNNILYFSMQWQQYMLLTWCTGNIICHLRCKISNITFHLHDALATISVFGSIHEQHFLFEHGAKTTIYVIDMMHLFSNIICHLHDELATHITCHLHKCVSNTLFLASFMNNISVLAWCNSNIIVIDMMHSQHYL